MAASDHASAGWASAVFATTLGQQLVLAFEVLKPNASTTLASLLVFHHNRWF